MIELDNPEQILDWSLEKLWMAFKLEVKEIQETHPQYKEIEEDFELVKNGIKIKYPIQYIIEEWYEMYPGSQSARIKGYGRVPIKDFIEDKELREEIMQEILIGLAQKDKIRKPRIQI